MLQKRRHQAYVEESVVQTLVSQISRDLPVEMKSVLINPNNDELIKQSCSSLFDQMKFVVENGSEKKIPEEIKCNQLEGVLSSKFVIKLNKLTSKELNLIIANKISSEKASISSTRTICPYSESSSHDALFAIKFFNALCHPEVVHLIANKLLNE